MKDEIINRVANSKLVVFDLEDYYPEGERVLFDVKDWLFEGFVLREKDFRESVKNYNWSQHKNQYVALTCSTDAIIPAWAFMLITLQLQTYTRRTVLGNLEALETEIYQDIISTMDVSNLVDKPVIIKGCAKKPVPNSALIMLSNKLKPIVKSILYGEACSSVPLYKR